MKRKTILIVYNVLVLFNLYFIIAALFTAIYIAIDYAGLGYIADHYAAVSNQQHTPIGIITHSLYFSFITLFAVGYGDITPFGLSRAVSMVQAFVGFILPYAIILNYAIINPNIIKFKK